jgi:hypothetical protein
MGFNRQTELPSMSDVGDKAEIAPSEYLPAGRCSHLWQPKYSYGAQHRQNARLRVF